MSDSLKDRFYILAGHELVDSGSADELWDEIKKAYSGKKRVYHNLAHLENLFSELEPIKNVIEDWNTLSWSVFYHDVVYNTRKQDNEELSAELAINRLGQYNFSRAIINKCKAQILATKSHELSDNHDTNLFTDADLSILGKSWETYKTYFEAIRKEYSIYPNIIYKPGRRKVLQHFLEMPFLFKTEYFRSRYEKQARTNIEKELNSMS